MNDKDCPQNNLYYKNNEPGVGGLLDWRARIACCLWQQVNQPQPTLRNAVCDDLSLAAGLVVYSKMARCALPCITSLGKVTLSSRDVMGAARFS